MPEVPVDPYANESVASAIPAATVVPLRDSSAGMQTVLLRRDTGLTFAGGLWVWPGGRIDPEDRTIHGRVAAPQPPDDPLEALEQSARRAAAREAMEEAGLVVNPDTLVWFAHFTPPIGPQRRYATFFFASRANGDDTISPDGHEVHEHRWLRPGEALDLCRTGDIGLSPPTWIVLEWLRAYRTADDALLALGSEPPQWCVTRFAAVDGGTVALYAGDAGYDTSDAGVPGARHRLWMLSDGWRYERHHGDET